MMTWNYRLMLIDGQLGVHEVYYDEQGRHYLHTEEPIKLCWDAEEGNILKAELEKIAEAGNKPILNHDGDTINEQTM